MQLVPLDVLSPPTLWCCQSTSHFMMTCQKSSFSSNTTDALRHFWVHCTLNRRISVHSYVHILDQWAGSPHFMNRNVITWNEHPSVSLHPTNEGFFFSSAWAVLTGLECLHVMLYRMCPRIAWVTQHTCSVLFLFCLFFCFFHAEADDVEERARSFMILRVGGRWWW